MCKHPDVPEEVYHCCQPDCSRIAFSPQIYTLQFCERIAVETAGQKQWIVMTSKRNWWNSGINMPHATKQLFVPAAVRLVSVQTVE